MKSAHASDAAEDCKSAAVEGFVRDFAARGYSKADLLDAARRLRKQLLEAGDPLAESFPFIIAHIIETDI
jgi:hypothetical protein